VLLLSRQVENQEAQVPFNGQRHLLISRRSSL
jgi:hypothetical protein